MKLFHENVHSIKIIRTGRKCGITCKLPQTWNSQAVFIIKHINKMCNGASACTQEVPWKNGPAYKNPTPVQLIPSGARPAHIVTSHAFRLFSVSRLFKKNMFCIFSSQTVCDSLTMIGVKTILIKSYSTLINHNVFKNALVRYGK